MIHSSHKNVVKEEWPLAWGSDDVSVCKDCGATGICLMDPCNPPKADIPKPRPSGWGQE